MRSDHSDGCKFPGLAVSGEPVRRPPLRDAQPRAKPAGIAMAPTDSMRPGCAVIRNTIPSTIAIRTQREIFNNGSWSRRESSMPLPSSTDRWIARMRLPVIAPSTATRSRPCAAALGHASVHTDNCPAMYPPDRNRTKADPITIAGRPDAKSSQRRASSAVSARRMRLSATASTARAANIDRAETTCRNSTTEKNVTTHLPIESGTAFTKLTRLPISSGSKCGHCMPICSTRSLMRGPWRHSLAAKVAAV